MTTSRQNIPDQPIGISHNATVFSAENLLGWFPARLSDWWFMEYVPSHFEKVDFFGMSYYGRIPHDPLPITYLETPEKMKALGRRHDDIWEYHPEGLRTCLDRYWAKYKKPIIITENGVCDESDFLDFKRSRIMLILFTRLSRMALTFRVITSGVPGIILNGTWDLTCASVYMSAT